MRKDKGFTLIELLAVIVILAIIALIAVPQILNIINKTRDAAFIRSAENYRKAIENNSITDLLINVDGKIYDGVYDISELKNVEMDGNKPNEGWIYLEDGKTKSYSFKIDDYVVDYDEKSNPTIKKDGVIGDKPYVDEEKDYNNLLVHMNGTNWVFDYKTAVAGETIWKNQADGAEDFNITGGISLQDDAVYITGSTNSELKLNQMDEITIYLVAKSNSNDANFLITGNGTTQSSLVSIYNQNNNLGYSNYINEYEYTSNVFGSKYNVMAVTYDSVNKKTKFYINGRFYAETNNYGYYEPNYWLGNYGSWMKNYQIYYKFISIGDGLHTDSQIQDNSIYLYKKYVGEIFTESSVELPVKSGIKWLFDYSNAVSGEKIWNNKIFSYEDFNISGGINIQDDAVYITGSTNSVLKLNQMDEITIYLVAKSNSVSSNLLVTGAGTTTSPLINLLVNNNNLGYANYVNRIDYTSNIPANKYNVIAVTYDSINKKTKYYVNGGLLNETNNYGYYESNYWLGNYGNWMKNYQNYYKFISIGDVLHTDSQIIQNSNYLIEKYSIVVD